jgi:(S)-citramalyl-CoA lyase
MTIPRSFLFTPGSRPDRFAKAAATGAEALILDLEDAVAPADKAAARAHVVAFLANRTGIAQRIVVRINPLDQIDGLEDLAALARLDHQPDYVLLPKVEEPAQLTAVARVLRTAHVAALIESARGVAMAAQIARADAPIGFLMFGAADYAADLGQEVGTFRPDHARAGVVNAAAAGGTVAVDSPFFAIDRPDALADDCRAGRAMGFHGKAAIHPAQIAAIDAAYAPTDDERRRARRIIDAAPDGVGVLDGKMIDVAMVRWARRLA